MSTRRFLVLAGLLCVSAPVVFAEARCPGSSTSLPLRLVQGTLFVVPVEVNGTGPYEFLVDTGAQVSSIEEGLADRLHLTPDQTVGVNGPGTYTRTSLVISDLKVGSQVVVVHSPAVLVHSAQLQAIGPQVEGILGESFLEHFDFILDNRRRVICLDQFGALAAVVKGNRVALVDPRPDQQQSVPFTKPIVISARLSGFNDPMLLALDSGTNSPFLFADHPRRHHVNFGSRQILKRFVDGREQDFAIIEPQDVRMNEVLIRGVSFAVPLTYIGQSGSDHLEDGALPTIAFSRIFVSTSKGYVILDQ